MEKWLRRNLKYITLIFLALFLIKTTQSCNRKMALRVVEKNLVAERDSLLNDKDLIINQKNFIIDSLESHEIVQDYYIKDLENDLEIAGVRVNAAERRADAVQRTAERVKTNTTIEIKGAERDTSKIEQ